MMSMWGMHITECDCKRRGVAGAIGGCWSLLRGEEGWMDLPGIAWRGCIRKDGVKARSECVESRKAVKLYRQARWQDGRTVDE